MLGRYKVKSADLRPLFERAKKMSTAFQSFSIRHVYREQNAEADRLANEAMDEADGRATRSSAPPQKNPASAANIMPRKLRAKIQNGNLQLEEPLDLPEGTAVEILLRLAPEKNR